MATVYHKNYLTDIGLLNLPVTAAHNRKHQISCFAKYQAMNISNETWETRKQVEDNKQ